jgi:O-methyltransferase
MSARMRKLSVIKFTKDFLLATRLLQLLQPLNKFFYTIYNFNLLTAWVHKHKKDKMLVNDFYTPIRHYDNRLNSFAAISAHYKLDEIPVCYLEFGVASGHSFKWWIKNCADPASRFYGFDTFEGLPEDWGLFSKGDMHSPIPEVNDNRALFIKGIFQDTLNDFILKEGTALRDKKKIIHMDADLFSATLFALSQLYPYLQKGDIIMFDEFNVYGHEFKAYRLFTDCFYVKLRPIAAQNNFYHIAFEVE